MAVSRVLLVSLSLLAAGCVAAPPGGDGAPQGAGASPLVPAFPQEHDHDDAALHNFASGMSLVGYHSLVPGSEAGEAGEREGWLNSEVIVRGDHAYVSYFGAPWVLAVVDIRDAATPKLVGTAPLSNAFGMDVAVSADGDWAFVSLYPGAVGTLFSRDYLLDHLQAPTGPAAPGVAVIDVRDRANPVVSSFLPLHGLGAHTATYHRYPDGREVVFVNKADMPPGNAILVTEVVATPAGGRALKPLSTFALGGAADADFPHDVDVQEHPLTGRTVLYAAYWDSGLVVVDVTDPGQPALLGQNKDFPEGEEVQVHDAHPFPRLVGGRHYTLAAPEIPTGAGTGHLRVFDTTDPAKPALVGSWIMPGSFVVDEAFGFSTHNFQFLPDGRVALAHGHAGVWIVDWLGPGGPGAPHPERMEAPQAVAYYVPHHGASPPEWSPVKGAPWVWGTAVDERGVLWAADVTSGLYSLRVDAEADR